jgi:hypothetical protein
VEEEMSALWDPLDKAGQRIRKRTVLILIMAVKEGTTHFPYKLSQVSFAKVWFCSRDLHVE